MRFPTPFGKVVSTPEKSIHLIHLIEDQSFWKGISLLRTLDLTINDPGVSLSTKINTEPAFIDCSGQLLIPEHGLALDLTEVASIFASQLCPKRKGLEVHLKHSAARLEFSPDAQTNLKDLKNLIEAFGDELDDDSFQRLSQKAPKPPNMCPCCQARGRKRLQNTEHNPLTNLFLDAIHREIGLLISIQRPGFHFLSKLSPEDLRLEGNWLIASGLEDELRINIYSLHGFLATNEQIDGTLHEQWKLLNTHGQETTTISCASELVLKPWRAFLNNPLSGYWSQSKD